jgi:hypothetical protein
MAISIAGLLLDHENTAGCDLCRTVRSGSPISRRVLPAAVWSMQARALLNRHSATCPITLLNRLPQVPDSAMPAEASLGCPQTEGFEQDAQGCILKV